jgi:hypothetical protein
LRVLLAVLLALGPPAPAAAYIKFSFTGPAGTTLALKWPGHVRYFVREAGVAGVSPSQLQSAVARAADHWQALPTASVAFDFAGFTSAPPIDTDDLTVIGFEDHPELERVLGSTTFNFDTRTGAITDADIFFNARFSWSDAAAGEAGRYDLESIATHEIGHLLGLGHSMIGETDLQPDGSRRLIAAEAVMFPIAFAAGSVEGRRLRPDDIAGVSDIYPDGGVEQRTGAISGRVLGQDGRGILGAHVLAMSLSTGELVSAFSVNAAGEFAIQRLAPGMYVVRVEPLDDGDVGAFFERSARVDIDFRATFFERPVAVPRAGAGPPVDIRVAAKQ